MTRIILVLSVFIFIFIQAVTAHASAIREDSKASRPIPADRPHGLSETEV